MGIKSTWNKLNSSQRVGVIIAITFGLFGSCCTCGTFFSMIGRAVGNKSDTVNDDNTPAIQVVSAVIAREYDVNEIAADEKYKGKVIEVSGSILDIKNDILDNPFIILNGPGGIRRVQCTFDSDHKHELAKLMVNQYVTVKGTCQGLMMNVQMDDCELVGN